MAAAGVFHAAGESWTLSSEFYDVTNYGLFSGDDDAARELTRRVMDEAARLACRRSSSPSADTDSAPSAGRAPTGWARRTPSRLRSVLELLEEYLDTGRIQVDPAKNSARVTLHDPCNLVRWGGVSEPQRRVLARVVQDFTEMTPNRRNNFCCGGGAACSR